MAKHKKSKLHRRPQESKPKAQNMKDTSRTLQISQPNSTPTIPFDAEDRILLIGEGDLSFAKSIVEQHSCYEVTATCLDSKAELFEKYKPQAEEHVQFLEDEGQTVLYGVDATKLGSIKALRKAGQYARILFNFPHVGGKSKDVNRQVRFNQELLVKFFTSAVPLLEPSGTIVVTLFEGEPYTLWNVRDLARHSGLVVQRSFKFHPSAYPGYSHSRTLGNIDGGGGWKGEDRESRSYVFQKKATQGSSQSTQQTKKRKRNDESSSDGE
jgi:25S rRNA (uracil2634-N3)-methyltransferase